MQGGTGGLNGTGEGVANACGIGAKMVQPQPQAGKGEQKLAPINRKTTPNITTTISIVFKNEKLRTTTVA